MAEEDIEFKWGTKRGVGGKRKNVQFYETFTYDGDEYSLFDSVYLYDEKLAEPYVGKLVKIWENPDQTKRIKVLWFFRPHEISSYLGSMQTLENELFLASGEGEGLANVNSLEAIAGKCNVVCTSKDPRNPQPTDEELRNADFIFYRTFDVGRCEISDKIDDKIAGVEVKLLLNSYGSKKPGEASKFVLDKKEVGVKNIVTDVKVVPPKKNILGNGLTNMIDGGHINDLAKESASPMSIQKSTYGGKISICDVSTEITKHSHIDGRSFDLRTVCKLGDKETIDPRASFDKQESINWSDDVKSSDATKIEGQKEDVSRDKINLMPKVPKDSLPKDIKGNLLDSKIGLMTKDDVLNAENYLPKSFVNEKVKNNEDSSELDNRPSKKAKFDGSIKMIRDKIKDNALNISDKSSNGVVKPTINTINDFGPNSKHKLARDSYGLDRDPVKILKPNEELRRIASGRLLKPSYEASIEDGKVYSQTMEVTRRPEVDKSRWFKDLPWEERMRDAHERGTLVLLQNLDRSYTSAEVEGLIWHAFNEKCTAKMVQQTTFSSPHYGQAFAIFTKREVAELVIMKLDEGCLMLSNGRPLVGSFGTPYFPQKKSTFFGHINISRTRLHMHREMKEAVSTSHYSQPNTLEYDMAMEWCLLQERSDIEWKKLYKQQGEELRKFKSNQKSK
ncbi:hypothetical protein K2173_025922 [Erythroxylum novogranatense]|uniref:BAH domain-containing protein n=1 Tax=Erythroxylum novogranatense TaxID=1862640 RepID=A0AAV8SIC5_9ROSI|nr:hypothetical protein K2173_025922 [Erythroxylum novogranatense]